MTAVPCTLGKVRNWDTVDNRAHSRVSQKATNYRLMLIPEGRPKYVMQSD